LALGPIRAPGPRRASRGRAPAGMDFDELDELAPVVENSQPPTGTVLPWIKRSNRVPGLSSHQHILPEMLLKQIPDHVRKAIASGQRREPTAKVRLLCAHGVADTYKQDWFLLEADAPPEVEVAVHEYPGHGHREKEPLLGSIAELANDAFEGFKDAMQTGSFALLGHSIGCLIVTELAKRAQLEFNVKPVVVFMVERGACQWPLFTPSGLAMLEDRWMSVAIDTAEADGRSFDLKEKELEDQTVVLIVSSTSEGLIAAWNEKHPDHAICLYDEIVSVNGVKGVASKLRSDIEGAIADGKQLKLDLRRRPYEFFMLYNADVAAMSRNGPTRALDRWQRTWRCENDTLQVGYHTFSCPLVTLPAEGSIDGIVDTKDVPPPCRAIIDAGGKTFNKELGNGKAFIGHYPLETFDDWLQWTDNTEGFRVVECKDCNHMSIKSNKTFKDTVYGALSDLVKLWSRT